MFLISVSDGDVIYQTFKNEDGNVSVAKFIAVSFIVKYRYVFSWMQVLAICNSFHFLFSEINFLQNLFLRRNSIDHKLIYILNYVKKKTDLKCLIHWISFFKALKEAGFRVKDRRLQETMANFAQYLQQENFEGFVDETTFRRYQFHIFFSIFWLGYTCMIIVNIFLTL